MKPQASPVFFNSKEGFLECKGLADCHNKAVVLLYLKEQHEGMNESPGHHVLGVAEDSSGVRPARLPVCLGWSMKKTERRGGDGDRVVRPSRDTQVTVMSGLFNNGNL